MIKRIFIKLILAVIIVFLIGGATFVSNLDKYGSGEMDLASAFKSALVDGLNKGLVMSWNSVVEAAPNIAQRNIGSLLWDVLVLFVIWGFVFCIISIPFDIFYAETETVKPFLVPALVSLIFVLISGWYVAGGTAVPVIIQNITNNITNGSV